MALAIGARLGPYEILSALGAGGMGEVYRARDTRLDRTVAIKVLRDALSVDPQFRDRFDREARTISQLDHPHICSLYDVGEQDGTSFLVMPYLEGETLEAKLKKGALSLDRALEYAIQIADALDKAHRAGITHRDLKPGNIMLTKTGATLLDFGLAKAGGPVGAAPGLSMLPTTPPGLTVQGTILGTFQYMAPEQLEGHEADARTDIFAFGAVMYEMLTGKKAFVGKSQATLIAAIMSSEPASIAVDQPLVAPALDRIVRKCLAKDPEARWQTARDLHDELQWVEDTGSHGSAPTRRPVNLRRRWPWAIVAAALAVGGFMSRSLWYSTRPIEQPLIRLDVDLGPDVALAALGSGSTALISPDGTRLVYAAGVSGGQPRLFTRRLDQAQATELPGTDGATWPFFSPDGQWVGFTARNVLNKISVEGGLGVPLGGVAAFVGASWGRDGSIIMGTRGLVRIPDGGGTPTTVTELASGESIHARPQILPGGKAVLFTVARSTADAVSATIEVVSLGDQHRKTLLRGGALGRFVPSGHLVYGYRGTVWAIPFDLDRLETRGKAVPVMDGVAYIAQSGFTDFDISDSGTLVYRKGGRDAATPLSTLHWLDGTGRTTSLRDKPGNYEWPSFSPDGQRLSLSVAVEQGTRDVWIHEWQRDTMTRLTVGVNSGAPIWSPDGRYLIFSGGTAGGIFWTRADGAGQPQPLTQSRNFQVSPSFNTDGTRLAYVEPRGPTAQIWTVPVEDHGGQLRVGTPELFLTVPLVAPFAIITVSPDGRWLAYPSTETGSAEVYVRPFPAPPSGPGSKRQISNAGGVFPIWSRTGHELFYQSGDQIMTVSYTVNGDAFMPEKPRVWAAKLGSLASNGPRRFDVAPDGKRLAVLTPVEPVQAPKVDHDVAFVLNFFDELRRRAPVGK